MAGIHKLTVKECENAAPRRKVYRLSDGAGLFLTVMTNGSRYWQLRYHFGGKERLFQIGSFSSWGQAGNPPISLKQARAEAEKWRSVIRQGKDPVTERRVAHADEVAQRDWTFKRAAEAWIEHERRNGRRPWSAAHLERNRGLLRRLLYPSMGNLPIARISTAIMLKALKEATDRGIVESARRARGVAEQVFRYAIVSGQTTENPAQLLARTIKKPEVRHFAALSKAQLPALMQALDGDRLEPESNAALRLMLYTGLRDHELRAAHWREVDLDAAAWTIPAVRMKRRTPHTVPLPTQATEVLDALRGHRDPKADDFVFSSAASKSGYLAENTLRMALHRLGFKVTAHGLRSLLTDTLNELGFRQDWIEAQLHHAIRNATEAAYKRTAFLDQRRVMMQFWADYCDARKAGSSHEEAAGPMLNVAIPLRAAA